VDRAANRVRPNGMRLSGVVPPRLRKTFSATRAAPPRQLHARVRSQRRRPLKGKTRGVD
jgi:hypothetical protein